MKYDFKTVEAKWQKVWEDEDTFHAEIDHSKPKFYALVEFPYPSGQGLHVGHPRSYTALDIVARKKRMQGYNVLFPIGFDAFGLPTENFAIKNHIHPAIVIVVPMVIEKIIRKMVFPLIQQRYVHLLLNMPVVNKKIKARILQQVKDIFGGQLFEMMFGGAGLNREVEDFLRHIGFPLAVGYGTTETAPLITYSDYRDFVRGTCGRVVDNMEIRIASPDPANVPGEILTRGTNVMLGYYKNPEATQAAIDAEGWFHTGDLGTMDADGNVYINGRSKNMLLGSNGQNIYPEEIENKLNSMMMVNESVIIQRDNKLVGLVHPDMDAAKQLGFSIGDLGDVMEENRKQLNSLLPAFCKVSAIQIHEQEFEKTPKKSIKRYLYQNA